MESTGSTTKGAFRPRSALVISDSRANTRGTSSTGMGVQTCSPPSQQQIPPGAASEEREKKNKERNVSTSEQIAALTLTQASPPLIVSESDSSLDGKCLLERCLKNCTPFGEKALEIFVSCLSANDLYSLARNLNLDSLVLEVLNPDLEKGKKLGIEARSEIRGQQFQAQHAVIQTLILKWQKEPRNVLPMINTAVVDKEGAYEAFVMFVNNNNDCKGIRDYCALPERGDFSVPPDSIMQMYAPLQITCHVGESRGKRPATSVQAQAIAKELTRVESAQCSLSTGFKTQMSAPAGSTGTGYFPCVYVFPGKASSQR